MLGVALFDIYPCLFEHVTLWDFKGEVLSFVLHYTPCPTSLVKKMATPRAVKLANKVVDSALPLSNNPSIQLWRFRRLQFVSQAWWAPPMIFLLGEQKSMLFPLWNWMLNYFTNRGCRLKVLHAGEVTKNQRKLIWSIFEANMQSLLVVILSFCL